MSSRRDAIRGIVAVASLGAFLAGYSPTIEQIFRPKREIYPSDPQRGSNVRYVNSVCLGCNVRCGIRVRIVNRDGVDVIERIEGNPYHPYNRAVSYDRQVKRYTQLDYQTPVEEAMAMWHGTLCARGQDGIHYVYDPYRVLKPLKRAGPRGSGKWKTISWEQLVKEVVEGGVIDETGERLPGLKNFFVYGRLKETGVENPNTLLAEIKKDVDSLVAKAKDKNVGIEELTAAIEGFKEKWTTKLGEYGLRLEDVLIDPDRPDLGFLANKIVFVRGRGQGHADYFYQRWVYALGSVNWLRHTSACQLGYYAGNRLWSGYTDVNADVMGAKVVIMAGATMGRQHPGATGQGLLIERAVEGEVKVYYVNPTAPRTLGTRGSVKWVPVKPGEDAALAMAMIRWMIENNRFDKEFLSITNSEAAKTLRGYPVNTNATWLVIFENGHPRFGEHLKASDIGLEGSQPVVSVNGVLMPNDAVEKADIEFSGRVQLSSGEEVLVKTPFTILKEEAFSKTLEEWSEICGVPVETIVEMAHDFTEAAPRASTYLHRGVCMHPNGEYAVWAFRVLDIIVGNLNRKGGLMARAAHTNYNGYLYNTGTSGFGEPPRLGPPVDRHGYAYENTLEYLLKLKRGENPYPAKRPWYPLTPEESYTELFAAIAEGYPYGIGALIMYYANPVLSANYGIKFIEVLKNTQKIPLFIAITTTINETFMYADYIVPDTTYLETGTLGIQYLYATSGGGLLNEGWRSPIILPMTEYIGKCPNGHDRWASMWEFLIDVAKALKAPGYGEKGIPGVAKKKYDGQWFPLNCLWEYIMRVYSNGALDAKDRGLIPAEIPSSEVGFVEQNYPIAKFKDILPADEWRYVTYALARGGVFTKYDDAFNEKGFTKRSPFGDGVARLWNETLAKTRNSVTGERFYGGPKYIPAATYAPIEGKGRLSPLGTPLSELWPATEYPLHLVFLTGPLMTKHRSQFYYWIRQILPENFVIINPRDAEKFRVKNSEFVEVETPYGVLEAAAVVEPTVMEGVIAVPYGLGRWSDTVIKKTNYLKGLKDPTLKKILDEIPDEVSIPEEAVNPVKQLPPLVKQLLFTKSPDDYYMTGLKPDEWRFNGVTPNPILLGDPSLGDWPLLSWIGAAQAYYDTKARLKPTGKKMKIEVPQIIW
ncbi:molybdopterin oxidoreductase, molybdopterin binding subunit [Candidatus Caldarchaeum subterraneum]|uniref:Molybdopterin oxidoreductase, molybdopterin binding subunit n=1 Tax=Caldiarchaeum subterraneum TaxID=311458 RepID=E6N476_CALS0|nr:molybdopterin oxidoreductase, molybdopterin binding subunit [Candidatus Caldarchaeum subterraneum]BAJ49924.1 molybdopterin oxidoreductase, molybdopterin binding subunit [Candidatus Caldarchaeum subterraneum]GBC72222.1 Tetrathionate reductase subunit A [archaeon HR03]